MKLVASLFFFFLAYSAFAQFECPILSSPIDGEIDVPVDATISWTAVDGVDGYFISVGTSVNGTDIIDNQATGSPFFTPDFGLPENANLYVTITLFFFDDDDIICPIGMFRTEDVTTPPLCLNEIIPANGSTDVSISPTISWQQVSTATGYLLSLGSSSGIYDIIIDELIQGALLYEVIEELPFETEIFVRLIPTNENGVAQNCQEFSFTTEAEVFRPSCTQLTSPADGEVNVPLTPLLEWDEVPGADGYKISIGTSATENDILVNGSYSENAIEVIDFAPNGTFYVTVTPFNQAGDALNCMQTSFTTILGCGPVFDPVSGEMVSFSPEIEFPSEVALCLNEDTTIISSDNIADGHRWYKINDDQTELLLSETSSFSLEEVGIYRYEAFNLVTQLGDTFECSTSKTFFATTSELPTINNIDVLEKDDSLDITVNATGIGDYEYAIDTIDGPYQDSTIFLNISLGAHTIYVRDKNGCGIVEEKIFGGLTNEGFPLFFTPNGDGINDFWQFAPPQLSAQDVLKVIFIFDRYGSLLKQLEPDSIGWDGSLNGTPLPAAGYWFKAIALNDREIKGHFTLKR